MSRIAFVNGRYLSHRDASVHIEDRGYQFADGVYEVCEVRDGRIIDMTRHLSRLARSLAELRIAPPIKPNVFPIILREVVDRNRVRDGTVYVQVTRGVAKRDHAFPTVPVRPSLVVSARSYDRAQMEAMASKGVGVVTVPDNRWGRVDIKSIGLLPNVLAKQMAREAGAREAWFVDAEGKVTEGASSNAWIVLAGGTIVTRQADQAILRGVTRTTLMDLLRKEKYRFEERPFTISEAKSAIEAFITSASSIVLPVITIDGTTIGNGAPGVVATTLRRNFHRFAERT